MSNLGRYPIRPRPKKGELEAWVEFMKVTTLGKHLNDNYLGDLKMSKNTEKSPTQEIPDIRSIKPDFVEWVAKGTTVIGRIVDRTMLQLQNGQAPKYTLEGLEGKRLSFIAPTILANLLDPIPNGVYIEITQLDGGKGKKGDYKDFDVLAENHSNRHERMDSVFPDQDNEDHGE